MSTATIELLKRMKATKRHDLYIVPSTRRDGPMVELKSFWRSILREADIADYHIHDSRHTHASHLVSSGLSLPIVGRLLGHTSPATTQRYAHLADDPLRQAAEVMGKKIVKE